MESYLTSLPMTYSTKGKLTKTNQRVLFAKCSSPSSCFRTNYLNRNNSTSSYVQCYMCGTSFCSNKHCWSFMSFILFL